MSGFQSDIQNCPLCQIRMNERGVRMDMGKPVKVYVPVEVGFDSQGRMVPHMITWEDGRKYEIDKVTDVRPAPAMKAGGQGDRYTIWVNGQQSYLFFERYAAVTGCNLGRWFVERRVV